LGFWALWFPTPIPELTGTYLVDDGGIYYAAVVEDSLVGGNGLDSELPADLQWHRGLNNERIPGNDQQR
jgi:hypothetical protein